MAGGGVGGLPVGLPVGGHMSKGPCQWAVTGQKGPASGWSQATRALPVGGHMSKGPCQ
jgi:hypothetical protein